MCHNCALMPVIRLSLCLALSLALLPAGAVAQETASPTPEKKEATSTKKKKTQKAEAKGKYAGWRRVIIQPNGWGKTKAQAVKDLDRVMAWYEHRPGFRRDNYVAVVYVGRDMWQADGRVSYLAPPTIKPKTEKKRRSAKNPNVISRSVGSKVR